MEAGDADATDSGMPGDGDGDGDAICGNGVTELGEFCDVGPTGTCNVCVVSDTGNAGSYSFVGEAAGDLSGYSVASAGDVDGDGLDDLLIGAYGNDAGGSDAGKTYLMLGSAITAQTPGSAGSTFDLSTASYSFVGEAASDFSGHSVASAGDVDNDGKADLLIGAYGNDAGGTDTGKTYLMLGSAITAAATGTTFNLGTQASAAFIGEAADDELSYLTGIAAAGDVNGDGRADLLMGAPYNDEGEDASPLTTWEGKTYLILSPF